jgi:hypothetical protein
MKLIESKTLGTAAAEIEFTSIPQDGTDLVVLTSLRTSLAQIGAAVVYLKINGSTASFTGRNLQGNGSTAGSFSVGGYVLVSNGGSTTSNTFANGSLYLPNYTSSANKSFSGDSVTEHNATESYQSINAGLRSNTDAITSLSIYLLSGDFVADSTVSLYQITKGSDGIVTTSP